MQDYYLNKTFFSFRKNKHIMKKVLRFLGILILILAVGYLVLCLVTPAEFVMDRKTTINAPKALVWEQMVKFNNWTNWSPWEEMDSTMKWEVTGTDGEKGSVYHWYGSANSGEGEITNTGVENGKMTYDMHFIKPMEGRPKGFVQVQGEDGKVEATWHFEDNVDFFKRGLTALFAKGMMQASFDRGLKLLKTYSEEHANDVPGGSTFNIEETQFAARTYAGIRKVINWADMMKFYSDTYEAMGKALGSRIAGPPSDIVYKWDETNQQADMHVGFPVADNKPVEGGTIVEVATSPAYKIVYTGGYAGSAAAHVALGTHVGKNGKKMGLVIEEYIKGPGDTKDSNQYVTNIYYLYN